MKKLRVNKIYGEWYYEKLVDDWDTSCWVYSLSGRDIEGKEWFFSTIPSYQEMIDIVKSNSEQKEVYLNF